MRDRENDRERLGATADRLVEHIAGKPAASLDMREACRQLAVLLMSEVPADVAAAFRLSPRQYRESIEAAVRSMFHTDPAARALINSLSQIPPARGLRGKDFEPASPASRPRRAPITYGDFIIRFGPPVDGLFPVTAEASAVARSSFRIPAELSVAPVTGIYRDLLGGASRLAEEGIAAELAGDRLFKALFNGQVLSLFDRCLGSTQGTTERSWRIKLQLDIEHPEILSLHALPWELLYRRELREFLALSRKTPVVRGLDVLQEAKPEMSGEPLRILLVTSTPAGCLRLDVEREVFLIEEATRGLTNVTLVPLEHATPEGLSRVLRDETVHVLHFMGHGGVDPTTGYGLILEDQNGNPCMLSGPVLADLLRDCESLTLAVLSACRTGEAPQARGQDPFTGVAPALVMAGLPAVLAMQSPISDRAAIVFSEAFYSGLAAGNPVESATAGGRKAIRSLPTSSAEWSIPVLFLR